MQVHRLLVVGVFSLTVSAGHSLAQGSDLVGTWVGDAESMVVHSPDEIVGGHRKGAALVIEDVDGRFVRAYKTWMAEAENEAGYIEDTPVTDANEPLLGVISSDGTEIDFVEIEDEGLMFCQRSGPDEIEVIYLEGPPHSTVATATLHRAE